MDPGELIDYALGRLDPPRRERLERQIGRDPELAQRVARLLHNVDRLLDDGLPRGHADTDAPPRHIDRRI
jgi:anti-sigma factor RsiW